MLTADTVKKTKTMQRCNPGYIGTSDAAIETIDGLVELLRRCQFRIYGAGVGTDDLFRDLYAVTREE